MFNKTSKKMKKIFYILFAFTLSYLGYSQENKGYESSIDEMHGLRIKNGLFEITYSESLEQPLSIKYRVECPFGKAERTGMNFYSPDTVYTSDSYDYEDNIWDKGHMVPANAFNCSKDTLHQTFNYINCALQHKTLNRGVWSQLERFERDIAKFYEVKVEIKVLFVGKANKLTTGATVPSGFIKSIKFDGRLLVFYFPNNRSVKGKEWHEFIIN